MRSSWHALHAHLVTCSRRFSFHHDFCSLRDRHKVFTGLRDPADLLDRLHGPGGDADRRNRILRALIFEAQRDGPYAPAAVTLLILALWPGLDAVHGRLWRYFRSEPEALTSEISVRIVAGIQRANLDRVNRVAATLIRNIERDIRRMLMRQQAQARLADPLDEAQAGTWLDAGQANPGTLSAMLAPVLGRDTGLVLAIAVGGATQQEAAAMAGLGFEAGRKRYQRAMVKLRRHLAA
jgi:RNA polymerase sigma-70 factor (ECF subfamily)